MNANVKKYLIDKAALYTSKSPLSKSEREYFEEFENRVKNFPKYFHPRYFISVWNDLGEGMTFCFSQWRKVERKIKLGFNSQNLTEITVIKL